MFNLNIIQKQPIQTFLYTFFTLLVLLTPITLASAQSNPLVPCGRDNATEENVSGCNITDLIILLQNIYNFLLGLSAFVALAFIIWGGIQMFSPSPSGVEGGKKTLTYAITGLVIIITAYLVVNTLIIVLSGGGTNLLQQLNPLSGS